MCIIGRERGREGEKGRETEREAAVINESASVAVISHTTIYIGRHNAAKDITIIHQTQIVINTYYFQR